LTLNNIADDEVFGTERRGELQLTLQRSIAVFAAAIRQPASPSAPTGAPTG